EEIALADQWRAKGIAGDKLYAYAIEDGYREVAFKDARKRLRPDKIYNVPVGSAPQRGPATAPVTIIAFGDFECPFCARGNDTVEQMRLRYGNQVRVVYRNYPLPFHSHAFLAARGSMYAQAQGKFWEFHDALYALRAEFDEDVLVEVARKVGMAAKPFREALHSDRFDAKILGDQNLARKVGVTGTPAYFVNGRVINGAAPPLEFRLAIEEELQRASAAIASGVAPEKLYEHLVSEQAL
ncbi:MAG: DsbA family protein, partial [Nannocystaceae bacterium]